MNHYDILVVILIFLTLYLVYPGMERELGDKTHDGAVRRRQHHILRTVS